MDNIETVETSSTATLIAFSAGWLIGSLATYFIVKRKYDKKLEEKVNGVIEYYAPLRDNEEISNFVKSVDLGGTSKLFPKEEPSLEDAPKPITQEQYVEDLDYEKMTVVYYADGVLADTYDRELNISDTVGTEAINLFDVNDFDDEEDGYIVDDTVYARNPKLGIDYEIVKDNKTFASLIGDDLEE